MPRKPPARRLLLGPIVGHTDFQSTRIWIRVTDDPDIYRLRINGHGIFKFQSTEQGMNREFGTAIAIAHNLRADWQYRYQVLRRGRVVPRARGTFRTMPHPGSMAEVLFVSLSGCHRSNDGAWPLLAKYNETAKPRFLLMTGDQVYVDQGKSAWDDHLHSPPGRRRQALADKYYEHWSLEPLRTIMANIPTYMIWDDHEVRDGWGSWAGDSPTLAAQYPRGATIAEDYELYFNDARDVYWHFQAVHGPGFILGPEPGTNNRYALPYFFECGRLCVLVLDGRGARDVWRKHKPVLGSVQWKFIYDFLGNLRSDIDALAVVNPVPIVGMAPNSMSQRILGERSDDVALFGQGKAKELLRLQKGIDDSAWEATKAIVAEYIPFVPRESSAFQLGQLDDVRDQWSHHFSQPEQEELIRAVAQSTLTDRIPSQPRGVVFVGGDIHVGAIFKIVASKLGFDTQCVIGSAISQEPPSEVKAFFTVGEENFEVAPGITAVLENFVRDNNFAVTQIVFNGATPIISNSIAHAGAADYWVLKFPLERQSF